MTFDLQARIQERLSIFDQSPSIAVWVVPKKKDRPNLFDLIDRREEGNVVDRWSMLDKPSLYFPKLLMSEEVLSGRPSFVFQRVTYRKWRISQDDK